MTCNHSYKTYVGFTDKFEYCQHCDKKRSEIEAKAELIVAGGFHKAIVEAYKANNIPAAEYIPVPIVYGIDVESHDNKDVLTGLAAWLPTEPLLYGVNRFVDAKPKTAIEAACDEQFGKAWHNIATSLYKDLWKEDEDLWAGLAYTSNPFLKLTWDDEKEDVKYDIVTDSFIKPQMVNPNNASYMKKELEKIVPYTFVMVDPDESGLLEVGMRIVSIDRSTGKVTFD